MQPAGFEGTSPHGQVQARARLLWGDPAAKTSNVRRRRAAATSERRNTADAEAKARGGTYRGPDVDDWLELEPRKPQINILVPLRLGQDDCPLWPEGPPKASHTASPWGLTQQPPILFQKMVPKGPPPPFPTPP